MTQDATTRDFTTTIEQEEQEDVVAADDSTDAQNAEDSSSNSRTPWHLFDAVCPKEEIVFLCRSSSCSRSS